MVRGELRTMIEHVVQNDSWTARRLREVGVHRATDVHELSRLPLTSREQLAADQRTHPPFGTNLARPLSDYVRASTTRGSTGRPLHWLDTASALAHRAAVWRLVFSQFGVKPDDQVLVALPTQSVSADCMVGGQELGALMIQTGDARRDLSTYGATVLVCTPSNALQVARAPREQLGLRLVLLCGEPGGSVLNVRRRIETTLGVRCADAYALAELGVVAWECATERGCLHVSNDVLPELIDSELVLTGLTDWHMPLVRYCTGDLVRDLAQCGCEAAPLALVGGIIGRRIEVLNVRGVRLLPSIVEDIVRRHPAVVEVGLRVFGPRERCELTIELEPEAAVASESDRSRVAAEVSEDIRRSLGLLIPCEVVSPGSLRAQPSGRRARRLTRQ